MHYNRSCTTWILVHTFKRGDYLKLRSLQELANLGHNVILPVEDDLSATIKIGQGVGSVWEGYWVDGDDRSEGLARDDEELALGFGDPPAQQRRIGVCRLVVSGEDVQVGKRSCGGVGGTNHSFMQYGDLR